MSNLFTAVSVEQQEIVSGGVIVPSLTSALSGQFSKLSFGAANSLIVTKDGSQTTGLIAYDSIFNSATRNDNVILFNA